MCVYARICVRECVRECVHVFAGDAIGIVYVSGLGPHDAGSDQGLRIYPGVWCRGLRRTRACAGHRRPGGTETHIRSQDITLTLTPIGTGSRF